MMRMTMTGGSSVGAGDGDRATRVNPFWLAEQQPCAPQHTPCPSGYLAGHAWAEKMSKTHKQTRCPACGLWAIWVPKENANAPG